MVIYPSIVIVLGQAGKEIANALNNSIAFRFDEFQAVDVIPYPLPGEEVEDQPSGERKKIEPEDTDRNSNINVRLGERNRFIGSIKLFTEEFDNKVESVMGYEAEQAIRRLPAETPVNRLRAVNVYIAGALAEPACSGIFLDIAYFCRHRLTNRHGMTGFSINGLFTLTTKPSKANSSSPNEAIPPGALLYAALKELDYFFETKTFSLDYLHPKPPLQYVRPFNLCYLLDTVKKNKSTLPGPDDLYKITGEILFHLIFPPMNEKMTNPLTSHVLSGYFLDQRVKAYSSIGLSSISFPAKDMLEAAMCRYAREVIRYGLLFPEPDEEEMEKELEAFELENRLVEKRFLDSPNTTQGKAVIDKVEDDIINNTDNSRQVFPWYDNSVLRSIEMQIKELSEKQENQWKISIREDREKKAKKLAGKIKQKTSELLHSKRPDRPDKAIQYSILFLGKLKENLRNRHAVILENKKNQHKEKAQRLARIQEVDQERLSDWFETIPTKKQACVGGGFLSLFSLFISYLAIRLYPAKAVIAVPMLWIFGISLIIAVFRWLYAKVIGLRDKTWENVRNWYREQVQEFKYEKDLELIEELEPELDEIIEELEGFLKNIESVEKDFSSREKHLIDRLTEERRFITDECIFSWSDVEKKYNDDREILGPPEHPNRNPRRPDDSESKTLDKWVPQLKSQLKEKIESIAQEKVSQSRLSKLNVEMLIKEKFENDGKLTSRLQQMLEDSNPLVSYGDMELPTDDIQYRTIFGYSSGNNVKIEEAIRFLPCECDSVATRQRDQLLGISVAHGFPLCDIDHLLFYKSEYEGVPETERTDLHAFENLESSQYDVKYLKNEVEIEAERLSGIAMCLGIINWKKSPDKKAKIPVMFKDSYEVELEEIKLPGFHLPFSLEPIIHSEGLLERLKNEIDKKLDEIKRNQIIKMLHIGLEKLPLTRIMRKEVELYLEKLE